MPTIIPLLSKDIPNEFFLGIVVWLVCNAIISISLSILDLEIELYQIVFIQVITPILLGLITWITVRYIKKRRM